MMPVWQQDLLIFYGLSTAAERYGTAERHTSAFGYGEKSLAVYRTCLMLLRTGFSVIISACFWKDSQTNPSQGPETLKLALQWGLNIFIITSRGSHQQRESLPLCSALWDWMSWMHRWVHSEIQTKTLHLYRLLIYKFIFSSAGCESHLHHLTVTGYGSKCAAAVSQSRVFFFRLVSDADPGRFI